MSKFGVFERPKALFLAATWHCFAAEAIKKALSAAAHNRSMYSRVAMVAVADSSTKYCIALHLELIQYW